MKYVYVLRSVTSPEKIYIGLTDNLNRRLDEHNAGKSYHTAKHIPWQIEVAIRFADDELATSFERYLKSGSGHAFAKRHLLSKSKIPASK